MNTPASHLRQQQVSLLICRTCPRDRPESGSFGTMLAEGLRGALLQRGVRVLMVACLGACNQPGSVALDCASKDRLRFSGLRADDTEPLIDAVGVYQATSAIKIDIDNLPSSMRSRLSAVSPKQFDPGVTPWLQSPGDPEIVSPQFNIFL